MHQICIHPACTQIVKQTFPTENQRPDATGCSTFSAGGSLRNNWGLYNNQEQDKPIMFFQLLSLFFWGVLYILFLAIFIRERLWSVLRRKRTIMENISRNICITVWHCCNVFLFTQKQENCRSKLRSSTTQQSVVMQELRWKSNDLSGIKKWQGPLLMSGWHRVTG